MSRFRRGLMAAALMLAVAPGAAFAKTDLIIGMTLEPPHLDPTAGAAAAIKEVTYQNVFETLTRIDESGAVRPGLAESWTISEDGLVYTFALREGVLFSDGAPFTADDVIFSYERARSEDSVNAQKQYFEPIESMTAIDPLTLEITLSEPSGLFLFNMGVGDASIVSPGSADANRTNPVGTGPYRLGERREGDRITLVRNPHYNRDAPYFETVTFRYITDPAAQVASLLAGDVDVFTNIGAPESLARFEADPRFEVIVGTTEGETIMSANWRREPFDDPLVRQALMHAIDRQGLVDAAMFGYGTPIGTHFAPHNEAYLDLVDLYPYDPDLARALLAEAGYPDGFSASLTLPPPTYARRGGEVIQAYLAEVGVAVDLIPVEWAQWLEQVFGNYDYDMTIVSHVEAWDIDMYARDVEDFYTGYENPAFNAVIAEVDRTTDPDARQALYQQAQRILAEDLAAIFLFQLPQLGVRDARVEGLWADRPVQSTDVTDARWVE